MYEFTFQLQPIALKRHRHFGHRTWNPSSKEQQHFRDLFIEQIQDKNAFPIVGPVELRLKLVFEMSKSWSQKKKDRVLGSPHISRPDLSNVLKFVEDALIGVAYNDDSQIWSITVEKTWGKEPEIQLILID